jgi:hypothetical protein
MSERDILLGVALLLGLLGSIWSLQANLALERFKRKCRRY